MPEYVINGRKYLMLTHQGEELEQFLVRTRDEDPDTEVAFPEFGQVPLEDGTQGPMSIPLGRLREEMVIRLVFPHKFAGFIS